MCQLMEICAQKVPSPEGILVVELISAGPLRRIRRLTSKASRLLSKRGGVTVLRLRFGKLGVIKDQNLDRACLRVQL